MKSSKRRFNKSIKKLKDKSIPNNYWKLLDFGRKYYNSDKTEIYRELIFVRGKKLSYDPNNWDLTDLLICGVPEVKTLWYSLGEIFNDKGKPVHKSISTDKNIYKFDRVLISNREINYRTTGSDEFFKGTGLESAIEQNTYLFRDRPYYTYLHKNKNGITEIYIPSYVVGKFFYYSSFTMVDAIIYGKLIDGICDMKVVNNHTYVLYKSNLVNSRDAKFISKYMLTPSSNLNGLKVLKQSIAEYHKELIIGRKMKYRTNCELYYKSPFDFPIVASVVGEFITKPGAKSRKFLVHKIVGISQYDNYNFFIDDSFTLIDLTDNRSSPNKNDKETKTATKISYDNDCIKSEGATNTIYDDVTTNRNVPREEFNITQHIFNETPEIRILEKEDQNYQYFFDKFISIKMNGYGVTNNNTNAGSTYQNANGIIFNAINSFDILIDALTYLEKDKDVIVEYATILDSQDYRISYAPSIYKNGSAIKLIDALIIAKVNFQKKEYCIIDAGPGFGIGFFINEGPEIQLSNDEKLTEFIRFMIDRHDFQWGNVFYDRNLSKELNYRNSLEISQRFKFVICRPMDHLSKVKNDIVENLANRILLRFKD